MPTFWEYPTVSMGLGPINSIYHARFNKYLHNRGLDDTSESRVWCFIGDGETDEPETLGSITLAAREKLDNLTWVINCNLQRLDGPVRGNGKIIQEFEAIFRGAGWNVIKVIWGTGWDELLARDTEGHLVNKMNKTLDGDYQRLRAEDGAYIREHFFGPEPELRALVEDWTDDQIWALRRGGLDFRKIYSAYRAATELTGAPTVILAKTIKGWTLGPDVEGRNATHQIKELTNKQLLVLRTRLNLEEDIPEEALAGDQDPPYFRPGADTPEYQYLMERRKTLHGSLPSRVVRIRSPLTLPSEDTFSEVLAGSGKVEASTTMAFTRLLRSLARSDQFGPRVIPIVPDEARTFGMDSLFRELKIYASEGQLYEPVDAQMLLSYMEAKAGQILEEGITEAGSMASFTAAASSYATRGVPVVPFYIFYSMFGFQRVGDLIWAAADLRARGFLLGATAGRTTLQGEGLQHQDGHSHLLVSAVPPLMAYDPAFAYEMGVVIKDGLRRMYGDDPEDVLYYLTLYNENYVQPPMAEGVEDGSDPGALPVGAGARRRPSTSRHTGLLGHRPEGGPRGPGGIGRAMGGGGRVVVGHLVQDAPRGGDERRTLEQAPPWRGTAGAAGDPLARGDLRPLRRRHRQHASGPRPDEPVGAQALPFTGNRRVRAFRHPRGAATSLRDRPGTCCARCAHRTPPGWRFRARGSAGTPSTATTSTPTPRILGGRSQKKPPYKRTRTFQMARVRVVCDPLTGWLTKRCRSFRSRRLARCHSSQWRWVLSHRWPQGYGAVCGPRADGSGIVTVSTPES